MNKNPFHGAQGSLPLGVYVNAREPQAVLINLAFVTAFILLSLVLILFVLARLLGRQRTTTGGWGARVRSLTGKSGGPKGGAARAVAGHAAVLRYPPAPEPPRSYPPQPRPPALSDAPPPEPIPPTGHWSS
jgi:phosphate transport system permease protein